MSIQTDKDKQVRISPGTYKQLAKLADGQGVSLKEMIHLMVTYFQVTKANAADPQADLPGLGIKKLTEKVEALDKRFIGFVREQEKELLKPILSEIKATRSQLTASPSAGGVGLEDLKRLSDQLQTIVFLMFGQALEANLLNASYIEEFNRKVSEL